MPAAAITAPLSENGRIAHTFSVPTADTTDWISTEDVPGGSVLILSDQALTIQVRNSAGDIITLPTFADAWLNPAALVAGYIRLLVPPEFRLSNSSGVTADVTVHLLPASAAGQVLGAPAAPAFL